MGKNAATVRTELQDVASLFSRPSASSASSDTVSLLYIPGFNSDDRFADQFCRLLWYVHPILPHVSEIRMATDGVPPACCDIPDYLDPKIAALAERFQGKVARFDNNDPQAWQEAIDGADVLLHWDLKSFHHDRRIAHLQKNAIKQIKRYRVDPIHEQYEGSMYLKLSHDLNPEFQKDLAASHTRFMHMLGELGACRKGYIFGTGPSLSKAIEMDFSDGLTIACNSMARNRALLARLAPRIFVVADPIFHAGCSSYAAAFREHLIEVLDTHPCWLIVPFRDYKVYVANLPERFIDRIIGIPLEALDHINVDLRQEFAVKTISNVLTLFLVPLACTLCEEVGILGCDGRKLDENKYFWSHHKESQLNDEMAKIQLAHPSFFAINYNDYYLKHCDTLEQWLAAGEAKGVRFANLTFSHIPALQKRSVPEVQASAPEAQGAASAKQEGAPSRMGGQSFVSVIMPAYNAEQTIARAVRSLQDDAHTNWELLIIDDHSTDGTRAVAEQLAAIDKRIRVLSNPGGKGVSPARNYGLGLARGEFITFLDADDVYFANALAYRTRRLEENRDIQAVYCPTVMLDEQLQPLWSLQTKDVWRFEDMFSSRMPIHCVMFRADTVRDHRFEEHLTNGEDWLYFARIARTGVGYHLVDGTSVGYVLHPNGTVNCNVARHEQGLVSVLNMLYGEDPGCLNQDPRFMSGLTHPPREGVLRQRRFRSMIELILQSQMDEAGELARQFTGADWKVLPKQAAGSVKFGLLRHFRRPEAQWAELWHEVRPRIRQFLFEHGPRGAKGEKICTALLAAVDRQAGPAPRVSEAQDIPVRIEEDRLIRDYFRTAGRVGVMIDVGAYLGRTAHLFLQDGWSVYAFEPDPLNREELARIAAQYPKLFIEPRAVSDETRTGVPFYRSPVSSGISGLHAFHDSHVEIARIETTTLSAFAQEKNLTEVDLLKIDTESYDLRVLKGFPWDRLQPRVVVCEFEENKHVLPGDNLETMARFLTDRGYEVLVSEWHPATEYGACHQWRRFAMYPCEPADPCGWGNIIAFHGEIDWPGVLSAMGREVGRREVMIQNRERTLAALRTKLNGGQAAPTSPARAVHPAQPKQASAGTPRPVQRNHSLGDRVTHTVKQIVKFHLNWGGLALAATLALFAYAFLGGPAGWLAALSGVGLIFATIAYVFVRCCAEAGEQAVTQSRRHMTKLQQSVEAVRSWTADVLGRQDRKLAGFEQRLDQALQVQLSLGAEQQDATRKAIEQRVADLEDHIRSEITSLQRETDAGQNQLSQALREQAEQLGQIMGRQDHAHKELEQHTVELEGRLISEIVHLKEAQAAEEEARARTLEQAEKLEQMIARQDQNQKELAEQAAELEGRLISEMVQLKEGQAAEQQQGQALRERTEQLQQIVAAQDHKPYQPFSRRLSEDDLRKLSDWATRLGVNATRRHLLYYQQRITAIEDLCLGRLAGSTQEAILRLLLARAVKKSKRLRVLEIGVLFGINAALQYDVLSCYPPGIHLTLIDPLEGFYERNTLDVGTGLPVSRSILYRNFQQLRIPRKAWTLIQAPSQSEEALSAVSKSRYDLVFIDGDHSYEGVKRDWEFYAPLVAPNGYIVFDDYTEKLWPGVTQFVDELRSECPGYSFVGSEWTTVVFRPTGQEAAKGNQPTRTAPHAEPREQEES